MKKLSAILISLCAISFLNGCDDYLTFVIEPQGDCDSEGATRYYPSEEGYCIHQICTNHRWKEIDKEKDDDNCGDVSCAIKNKNNQTEPDDSNIKYICGDCFDGITTCENDNGVGLKKECFLGKWEVHACPSVSCTDGISCGKCHDGDIKCVNPLDVDNFLGKATSYTAKCNNGTWRLDTDCQNSSCNSFKTACGDCIDGDMRCSSNNEDKGQIQQCILGSWQSLFNCAISETVPVSCVGSDCKENNCNPECGECLNGSKDVREIDNICSEYECINGIWEIKKEYQTSCIQDGNTKIPGECLNGTQKCNKDKTKLQTCRNGKLEDFMSCSKCDDSNGSVQCTSECSTDQQLCSNNDNNIGVLSVCKDHIESITPCPNNYICLNNTTCGNCQSNEERCQNNDEGQGLIYSCQDGTLTPKENGTCPSNNSCHDNECGECHNGDIQCQNGDNNAVYSKCENGRWTDISPCAQTAVSCTENRCGVCRDGAEKYDMPDGSCKHLNCINGQWVEDSGFSCSYSCTHENKDGHDIATCGECKNYSVTGNLGIARELHTCINGKSETNELCEIEQKGDYVACKKRGGLLNLNKDDKIECYNMNEDNKLIGYNRGNDKPCNTNSPVSCHVIGVNETECGECLELSTRCKDENTQQYCVNGRWDSKFDEICFYGCADGQCAPPPDDPTPPDDPETPETPEYPNDPAPEN